MSTVWTTSTLITMEDLTCGGCGILYAVPQDWLNQRRRDGKNWTCPNGCVRCYRKTDADVLREKLAAAEAERDRAAARARHEADQRQAAERSAAAFRGQATRLRKRVANGVCPCCNRQFQNLHRHMSTKHPGYAEDEAGGGEG